MMDPYGKVFCAREGGGAMDAYGKVQCAEECHDASPQFCEQAR